MFETHPFRIFCPRRAKYFILGSFVAKDGKSGILYDWYYSNGRNQFWPILEQIYSIRLRNKRTQQDLFRKLSIAVADIIYQCKRIKKSSSDNHLTNCMYNISPIKKVLEDNPVKKVLFTSRFVEKEYKKHFKDLVEEFSNVELITLPSPSPRYAAMRKEEKIKRYAKVLPKLKLE